LAGTLTRGRHSNVALTTPHVTPRIWHVEKLFFFNSKKI